MIRRFPHGATVRPPLTRPAAGFGRPVRPGPPEHWRGAEALARARTEDPVEMLLSMSLDDAALSG